MLSDIGFRYCCFYVYSACCNESNYFRILCNRTRSEKLYGVQKERKTINFLGKRKVCFVISIALVLSGFVAMGVQKSQGNDILNYSLEFKGGTATNVTFNEDYSIKELDAKVTPVIEKVTGDKIPVRK